MQIDIKTTVIQPKRHTFTHIAKRLGGDRPASRYEEGTLDLQAVSNFHYRPLWDPEFEQFDARRTKIQLADWYVLKDPRQYYYANYNITRAKQQEAVDHNFDMVEKRKLLDMVPSGWRDAVTLYLLPLRHYEWGANMNNCQITVMGYGTAFTAPCCFAMADRLGLAQLISRVGLALGNNGDGTLQQAKQLWMQDPAWQGIRHMVEDSLVVSDPFELFVAQNLAMDGIMHGLVFDALAAEGDRRGALAISLLTGFVQEWREETNRWVDSVVKTAAAESPENRAILRDWSEAWSSRAIAAALPLAQSVLGADAGQAALDQVSAVYQSRIAKLGIA